MSVSVFINRLPIGALLTFIFFSTSLTAYAESELEKLERYDRVSARIKWEWVSEEEPEVNGDLVQLYKSSGLGDDMSFLGVIYRNLLWASAPWPETWLVGKKPKPITEKNWLHLKRIDPYRYAVVKASIIFEMWDNSSKTPSSAFAFATQQAVKQLKALEREMVLQGNVSSAASVSVHLGRIYHNIAPVKAIEKYEYAIPHLSSASPKDELNFSNILTKGFVLKELASVYNNLKMHYHGLSKARQAISEIPLEWREAIDYTQEVLALARLGRFEEALEKTNMLIEIAETKEFADSKDKVNENFFARFLKLSVYTNRMASGDKEQMRELLLQLRELLPKIDFYNNDTLIETVNLFSVAVNGTSNQLRVAETQYFNTVSKSNFSPTNWKVLAYHNFRRANEIQGNFVRALENERLSHQAQLELNAQHFETLGDLNSSDALLHDIEMVNLRQVKAEQERQRLALKAQQQQGIILILVVILLAITTFWFWQRQRIVTKLAGVDTLTGAMTRRSFYSWYANTTFSRSTSCAVLIDLDHFKLINDQHGHLTGDEVLTCFSNIVQDRIRKTDKLCRYGGEEFLLMLKDSKKEEAELLIDDIRERLKAHSKWNTTDASLVVNFSAGIVESNTHAKLDALIDQCDKLLYYAKSNGRAQTVVATFGS